LMAVDFTLLDLNLYLNTHPYDTRALNLYNSNVQKAMMLRNQYQNMFGPLNQRAFSGSPWQWINEPWPWENRGGGC